MQQLSAIDSLFLHVERGNAYMHIGPVMLYEPPRRERGKFRIEAVLDILRQRLQHSAAFRQRLLSVPGNLDNPYWVEDRNFDVSRHITHTRLAAPGDRRQFMELLSRLHAEPLNRDRPLWQAYLIDGLGGFDGLPRGSFALYLKTHHAVNDGASGVEIVEAIHDRPVDRRGQRVDEEAGGAREAPSTADLLARAALNGLLRPTRAAGAIGRMLPALRQLLLDRRDSGRVVPVFGERTRFNARISGARVIGFVKLDLADLKGVRAAVRGATLNDVVLGVVSGALRRYLASKDELPRSSLIVGAPVNARSEAQAHATGNVLSAMRFSLCTDEARPLERLRALRQQTDSAKALMRAVDSDLISGLADSLPSQLLAWSSSGVSATGLLGLLSPVMHTLVSNVPGPRETLRLGSAEMRMIAGLGPCLDGIGLFHTASSYCDVMTIGFQSCPEMLPDPEFYEQCLLDAHKELRAAAFEAAGTTARRSKKATVRRRATRTRKAG